MPKSRPPYPPEFRQQIIELVRKGRTPESLAAQFEPTAQTIRNWLAQARSRRRAALGWPHDRRARGAPPVAAGEQDLPRRAGDPKKSRGLVCQGDRLDPIQGFESRRCQSATISPRSHSRSSRLCAASWAKPPAGSTPARLASLPRIQERRPREFGTIPARSRPGGGPPSPRPDPQDSVQTQVHPSSMGRPRPRSESRVNPQYAPFSEG